MRNLLARALRKAASIIGPASTQIDITDDYVTWLCYANAGMLDRGNLYLIDYALTHIRSSAPFLEIGSFCGLSTNLITHYKRKHGLANPLFTCDKWEFETDDKNRRNVSGSPVLVSDYKRLAKESYLRNIQTFSADDLPFTIEAFSDEFFALWRDKQTVNDVLGRSVSLGGPFSFCYVDGNHSYDGAKLDFEKCDQFLQTGGYILFDDSINKSFGVHRLMREVSATCRYRLVATNPNHLFMKISG